MPSLSQTINNSQLTVKSKAERVNLLNVNLLNVKSKSFGFTLIELLVVITIIGILAGLTLASFGSAQGRSRDSRRKTDLDAIKKAFELAKQDSPGSYYYPSCDSPNDGLGGSGCVLIGTKTNPDLTSTTETPYMQTVPTDPKTSTGYTYIPAGTGCSNSPGTCKTYTLVACLENTRDSQKDSSTGGTENDTACPGASLVSYTVKP